MPKSEFERLKDRREKLGLSVADLAGLLELDQSTLFRRERGDFARIRRSELRDWEAALKKLEGEAASRRSVERLAKKKAGGRPGTFRRVPGVSRRTFPG